MRLPAALAPWSDSLSSLTPDLAIALGPLVRGVDQLISSRDPATAEQGGLDGFEGLSRRGHPELMLVSEWLLADEVPVEFLRRAAQRELLHLAPAVRRPLVRGRVALLADTGPDQAGAGRLVQLACMVVLHRRAAALGAELAVGLLGEEPGAWRTGGLPELLRAWLGARRPTEPVIDDVSAWTDGVDEPDGVWILTGPRLASRLTGRRRVISSRESEWGEHGATHVRIAFKDGSAELALPDGARAVRALRGKEFLRTPTVDGKRGVADAFRFPLFPSSARRILARGRAVNELVSIHVPRSAHSRMDEPHLHRLKGPVLAASVLGNRIVAVIEQERMIRVQVIGKTLGRVKSISIPIEAGDLEPADIEEICGEGLASLYYQAGDVLCPFGGDDWWRLTTDGAAKRTDFGAIAPSADGGFDRLNYVRRGQRYREWCIPGYTGQIGLKDEVVLGGGGCARSTDGRAWQVVSPHGARVDVMVEPDCKVLGLIFDEREPVLVTRTGGGVLLRLVRPSGTRTLTDWSGLPTPLIVHPTLPLIAAVNDDSRLEVGDLITGEIVLRMAVGG